MSPPAPALETRRRRLRPFRGTRLASARTHTRRASGSSGGGVSVPAPAPPAEYRGVGSGGRLGRASVYQSSSASFWSKEPQLAVDRRSAMAQSRAPGRIRDPVGCTYPIFLQIGRSRYAVAFCAPHAQAVPDSKLRNLLRLMVARASGPDAPGRHRARSSHEAPSVLATRRGTIWSEAGRATSGRRTPCTHPSRSPSRSGPRPNRPKAEERRSG
jgi:hypothetical protein